MMSTSSYCRSSLLRWLLIASLASTGAVLLSFSSVLRPGLIADNHHSQGEARFLEVPQIAWGLNNQKIALARALLTARFLNRSLVLPLLSASLTYKDTAHIQPLPFDRLFSLSRFNELCQGFVSISKLPADILQRNTAFNVTKGSGRRWTIERDLDQLLQCRDPQIHRHALLKISGKNPFLWHDHWPVLDYARIFQCLVLEKGISNDVDRIVSKLRQVSLNLSETQGKVVLLQNSSLQHHRGARSTSPGNIHSDGYVAVHMRVEIDWMIHCKKTEERIKARQGKVVNICSSREEILKRVSHIQGLHRPATVYLAVADVLLEDKNLLEGWEDGLIPVEKKKLGLLKVYSKYPYLIQSALDYEICLQSDIFVGNSFSTFSSLIALERTLKMLALKPADPCSGYAYPSYAYNLETLNWGPPLWITNLSDVSLQAISYGTYQISCNTYSLMPGSLIQI
ncbi:hypothetical protein KP509_25G073500 [Ceratopteris richardii]|uniref:O-fucosyltransferase family protein n=1 Tax=Ceratopteris richardii TaxID=49495 RepID=A0A8T2RRM3_CERRI|nr:hypothetical protein KP509_25G073500 [Ceratopteris richardii]